MVRNIVAVIAAILAIGLLLGMTSVPEQPMTAGSTALASNQDAFQKFVANGGRFYVASYSAKKKGEDVLALLDQGELQKLEQTGKLQGLLQGERGAVLIVMSAVTSEEARGLAGPLVGKNAKSLGLTIRPAIGTKSFADVKGRKPIAKASMGSFEAAYSVKGKNWTVEGNAMSRKAIPEYINHMGSLAEKGFIKLFLAFDDNDDPRGFFIFSGKSRDDIRKMMDDEALVKEGWLKFDYVSCKAPEGTFK
jgi:hypothetical protein